MVSPIFIFSKPLCFLLIFSIIFNGVPLYPFSNAVIKLSDLET